MSIHDRLNVRRLNSHWDKWAVVFESLQTQIAFKRSAPDLVFWPHGFSGSESDRLFQQLMDEIPWQQEYITLYGRTIPLPRLTAWFGDDAYQYSGILHIPLPWTDALLQVKANVEQLTSTSFNSVLLNYYRNGRDSVAWHSDDEPELGNNPVIASVSFGAERRFCMRHRYDSVQRVNYLLTHGSVLLMGGATQHDWQHQVPKTTQSVMPRINLTFRRIVSLGLNP